MPSGRPKRAAKTFNASRRQSSRRWSSSLRKITPRTRKPNRQLSEAAPRTQRALMRTSVLLQGGLFRQPRRLLFQFPDVSLRLLRSFHGCNLGRASAWRGLFFLFKLGLARVRSHLPQCCPSVNRFRKEPKTGFGAHTACHQNPPSAHSSRTFLRLLDPRRLGCEYWSIVGYHHVASRDGDARNGKHCV